MSDERGVPLTLDDARALELIGRATGEHLRDALRAMPTYQRAAVRDLARGIAPVGHHQELTRPGTPKALRRRVLLNARAVDRRTELEAEVSNSAASPTEKALINQRIAHLWLAFTEEPWTPPTPIQGGA